MTNPSASTDSVKRAVKALSILSVVTAIVALATLVGVFFLDWPLAVTLTLNIIAILASAANRARSLRAHA